MRLSPWNRVWERFDRLQKATVFEVFFDTLASMSASAQLIQMFDLAILRPCFGNGRKHMGNPRIISRRRSFTCFNPMMSKHSNASR